MSSSYKKGIILIIISAIMFGINPAFSVMLRSGGMNLPASLLSRFLLSAIIYFFMLVKRGQLKDVKIMDSTKVSLLVAGLFFFFMALTLLASYAYIPSGLATVIHFTYPALVMLLAIISKQQKPSIAVVVGVVLSLIAVALISYPTGDVRLNSTGILLAAVSAIAISIYVILLNQEGLKDINSLVIVYYIAVFFSLLIIAWMAGEIIGAKTSRDVFGEISLEVIIGALGFGVSCAVGVLLFAIGVKLVGGAIAGAVSTLEPLTAVVVGTLVFKEPLPSTFIIAGIFIIGATILLSLKGETVNNEFVVD
ncbi:MAG: DMT family transporter [Sphaerochaetaceae bacterium]|nr:DMT family transporter [Sphaerochaetaceae bacterium]